MGKNKGGGSKHKKYAKKKNVSNNVHRKLRKPVVEGEIYARVIAVSGGSHAKIWCADKKERTLVIRGKFRGRNKRNNTISLNCIVIAGLRSVSMGEVIEKNKKEKADLIYVYDKNEMDELKLIPEVYSILNSKEKNDADDDIFDRSEETTEDIEIMIEKNPIQKQSNHKKINKYHIQLKKKELKEEKQTGEKLEDLVEDFDWDDI